MSAEMNERREIPMGPFAFVDIVYSGGPRETVLVANTDTKFSVACILLPSGEAAIAQYPDFKNGGDPYEGLLVSGGFSWAEGHITAAGLTQQWMEEAVRRHHALPDQVPVLRYDQQVGRFLHHDEGELSSETQLIAGLQMKGLERVGFHLPIQAVLDRTT